MAEKEEGKLFLSRLLGELGLKYSVPKRAPSPPFPRVNVDGEKESGHFIFSPPFLAAAFCALKICARDSKTERGRCRRICKGRVEKWLHPEARERERQELEGRM